MKRPPSIRITKNNSTGDTPDTHRTFSNRSQTDVHNILIIDDNDNICRSLKRFLKDCADTVISAHSFEEAVSVAADIPIHALICDYYLGSDEPSGIQIVEALRKGLPGLERAVILTGDPIETIPSSAHVDAVLEKGGDFMLLRALVGKKCGLLSGTPMSDRCKNHTP